MKLRALALVALASTQYALGGSITVSFSGVIVHATIPIIAVGDPFTGSFTYTIPSPGILPAGGGISYSLSQLGNGLDVKVDGYTFSASAGAGLTMYVLNGPSVVSASKDYLDVAANSSAGAVLSTDYPLGPMTFLQSSAQFFGNLNFLQSNALPSPFDTTDVLFGNSGGDLTAVGLAFDQSGSALDFIGYINAAQASSETPEPRVFLLCCVGLALILAELKLNRRKHLRQ